MCLLCIQLLHLFIHHNLYFYSETLKGAYFIADLFSVNTRGGHSGGGGESIQEKLSAGSPQRETFTPVQTITGSLSPRTKRRTITRRRPHPPGDRTLSLSPMATGPGMPGTTRRSSPTVTTTSPVSQTVTPPHIGTVTLNTVNNMGRAHNPSTGKPGTVRGFQDNNPQR